MSAAVAVGLRYDPVNNPAGARGTVYDAQRNILGRNALTGFALRPFDNVGVQYGLQALRAGAISKAQFLDLNERIGGYDQDANYVAGRSVLRVGVEEPPHHQAAAALGPEQGGRGRRHPRGGVPEVQSVRGLPAQRHLRAGSPLLRADGGPPAGAGGPQLVCRLGQPALHGLLWGNPQLAATAWLPTSMGTAIDTAIDTEQLRRNCLYIARNLAQPAYQALLPRWTYATPQRFAHAFDELAHFARSQPGPAAWRHRLCGAAAQRCAQNGPRGAARGFLGGRLEPLARALKTRTPRKRGVNTA